jgi:hypothetical protein
MWQDFDERWRRVRRSLGLVRRPKIVVLPPPTGADESTTLRELSMWQHPAGRGGGHRVLTDRTRESR